ncbi:MAG: flagellar basal body-associated FliL family protein [Capsulimonadaceae bacterium]|nr:flagellar basal body-associated FliL family protein [Capsulimonadaceae bacterium]
MADKAKTAEADRKTPEQAKKPKAMIFVIVGVVVAVLAGGLVAKQLMGHPSKKQEVAKVGAHLRLDEFLVNLADPSNDHYLKTNITLGLKEGVAEEQFKENTAPVRDAVLMLLTTKKLDDVRTPEGKVKLKEELKTAVNKALGKDEVLEVDFETFATQ